MADDSAPQNSSTPRPDAGPPGAAEHHADGPEPVRTGARAEGLTNPPPAAEPKPDFVDRLVDSPPAHLVTGVLDAVAGPPHRIMRKTPLADLLHGTRPLGHPLHPALSDLPIGLWIGAVLMFIFGVPKGALVLTIAGIVGALGAAVSGIADWGETIDQERRMGAIHGTVNVVATLAAIASAVTWFLVSPDGWSIGLICLATLLVISSAYLGGHLVFDRAAMVNHTALNFGPDEWTRAISADELAPGQITPGAAGGRSVLFYLSRTGRVSVIDSVCSHAGGPLGEGEFNGGRVTCPWHQSVFDAETGKVLHGPATRPQPLLHARVKDGWVEVRG